MTRKRTDGGPDTPGSAGSRREATPATDSDGVWFRDIFENSPDAIFIEDHEGNILDVNLAGCRLHGATRAELIGSNVLAMVPKTERAAVASEFPKWLTGELRHFEGYSLTKDGREVPVEIRASKIQHKGQPSLLLHVRDISERKAAEAALRRSDEQLRQLQKMEALGRLAGGVAHDFNNLLTSILGFGNLVLDDLNPRDPIRPDLQEIVRAAERAAELTRRLLAFSRKHTIETVPLDLNTIVVAVDKLLRRTIGEDVELVTLLGDDLGRIEGDRGQIEQVLMNLAINARDAMPGGGKLTIQTAVVGPRDSAYPLLPPSASEACYVMLRVADTGCGMSPEVREHALEPFFTTKADEHGTGLGLSSVFAVVQQFGGVLEFDSELERGTEFRAYFPRLPAMSPLETAPLDPPAVIGGNEHILVVEDEDAVRRLTVRILRSLGYRVAEATSGTEALRHCRTREEPLDLLLSDIIMPHMNGRALASQLRASRPGLKVLLMTGFARDEGWAPRPGSGPQPQVLMKPFTREALAAAVRRILDRP